MKSIPTTSSAVISALVIAAAAWYFSYDYPRIPQSWTSVKPGMSRGEAIETVGAVPLDMRDLKGFDIYTYEPDDQRYWQLVIRYRAESPMIVASVTYRFVDRGCGFRHVAMTEADDEFFERFAERDDH